MGDPALKQPTDTKERIRVLVDASLGAANEGNLAVAFQTSVHALRLALNELYSR